MIGSYIWYKGIAYIVLEMAAGSLVKILNPLASQVKLQVKMSNCTFIDCPTAKRVTYQDRDYLVTGKDMIISLGSGRKMNWNDSHKERLDILALASINLIN
jgi:hypothetical protein